jgi:hypothetical protein
MAGSFFFSDKHIASAFSEIADCPTNMATFFAYKLLRAAINHFKT